MDIKTIYINDSKIIYSPLTSKSSDTTIGQEQYKKISKANEAHLIEVTTILGKQYRGVTIDNTFWFLVEDLVNKNQNSKAKKYLIEKLLNNISYDQKGFIQIVDDLGTSVVDTPLRREYVLMVSMKGLKGKLFQ